MTTFTLKEFQEAYLAALRTHCSQGDGAKSMEAANQLGARAAVLGLETLGLASIHRQVLSILKSEKGTDLETEALTKLAADFFDTMLLPIEASHRTALEAYSNLERMKAELARITRKMDESTRNLELGIVERKSAEQELKADGELSTKLHGESRQLYTQVQEMARQILGNNEEERRAISRHLQDEIAQALVGIQVRLEVLRSEVSAHSENVRNEIDLTHQLVRKTVSTINRILRDFDNPHES